MADDLQQLLESMGATFMPYGPDAAGAAGLRIVDVFGAYELEYAAIHKGVGIMHVPHRGLLEMRGADVRDYLHRLMTQDINPMRGGESRRAFQLNVKGRIIADTVVHFGDASTWVEADVFDLDELHEQLDARLFAEDASIVNITESRTVLALHGPHSAGLLAAVSGDGASPVVEMPGTHHVLDIAGHAVTATRRDECGVPGVYLFAPSASAANVYTALLDAAGYDRDAPDPSDDPQGAAESARRRRDSLRGRPIGWLAYNTARIEAGTPIFHIDFGPDSLPAETGLLDDAVSFTKGCYLGQEIVARMHSLGHPRRVLVGLRFDDDLLPIAGTQVFNAADEAAVIGAVTSSAVSPVLGNKTIALAVVKWGNHTSGSAVVAPAEGRMAGAAVVELGAISDVVQ